MKKSNIFLSVVISITTISLGIVSTLFVNSYNVTSTTTPVVENNSYEAPGFEEDETLDENIKSNITDIIKSENPAIQSTAKKTHRSLIFSKQKQQQFRQEYLNLEMLTVTAK